MEITISLPEKVFAILSSAANKSHRRIDEVIAEKIERDFAVDTDELEKQIAVCSDKEVLELSRIEVPSEKDERLSRLLDKQTEKILSGDEQKELWQLMDSSRITTLKKAYALREISRRGLDGENLKRFRRAHPSPSEKPLWLLPESAGTSALQTRNRTSQSKIRRRRINRRKSLARLPRMQRAQSRQNRSH